MPGGGQRRVRGYPVRLRTGNWSAAPERKASC